MRARLAAARVLPRLFQMIWRTHPWYASAVLVLRLMRAFVPVTTLWIAKLIIDAVVAAAAHRGPAAAVWRAFLLEMGVIAASAIIARASVLIESLVGDLFSTSLNARMMEHAATLDLQQFEDPGFNDLLERARRGGSNRVGTVIRLIGLAQDALTLTSLVVALAVYRPPLIALLLVSVIPAFLGETHFAGLSYNLFFRFTSERRELDYYHLLGTSNQGAKEVKALGLSEWLVARYRALAAAYFEMNRRLTSRRFAVGTLLSLVATAGYYGAYAVVLTDALAGALTIGTLTFLSGSFGRSRDLFQSCLSSVSATLEDCLYIRDLYLFLDTQPMLPTGSHALRRRQGGIGTVRFDNVSFRYSSSGRWAVRNVSFILAPGERVALVGENGAGKTTIVKLLMRLYDPTEGRILVDDVDLREYEAASIRDRIAVVFQDFLRYDMRLDENLGVGDIRRFGHYLNRVRRTDADSHDRVSEDVDRGLSEILHDAARQAGAWPLIERLQNGSGQMLGRRFEGGIDLSGGEWQKVALARAYVRDADLVILDEPTAAIDARAEHEVFQQFSELMKGRTALLISHRFSTVRIADRIIVLRQGRLTEDGHHSDLLASKGEYAELFELQAAGYR